MFFHQGLLYFTLRTFTVLGFVPKPTFQTKSELVGPVMIVGFFFAIMTTSETVLFQLMGDSKHPKFRTVSKLVKEHGQFSRNHELTHL